MRRIVGFGRGERNFEPKTCLPRRNTESAFLNLTFGAQMNEFDISNLYTWSHRFAQVRRLEHYKPPKVGKVRKAALAAFAENYLDAKR